MTASAVTDLPEPDSPTIPRISPGATANETSRTAATVPRREAIVTDSPSISSSGWGAVILFMIAFGDRRSRAIRRLRH